MSTLKDLALIVSERYDMPQPEVEMFINEMFDVLKAELSANDLVKIKGLGTFKVQTVQERASVSVQTGEKIVIDSHDRISFTPDNSMKESVNKPFAHFETVALNEGVVFDDIEDVPSQDTTKEEDIDTETIVKEEPVIHEIAEAEAAIPEIKEPELEEPEATEHEIKEVEAAPQNVEEDVCIAPTPLLTISEPSQEDEPRTKVEIDQQTEVEPDGQTEVMLDNQTKVETDQQTKIEPDGQTEVVLDNQTKVETDQQTKIEPDGQTAIEQFNESIDTNMNNDYDKDYGKISGWITALLAVLILVVGFVIGRATSDITFDDIKEAIYPTKQKPIQEKVEYLQVEPDSVAEDTAKDVPESAKKDESKAKDAEKSVEEEIPTIPENQKAKTPTPAAKPAATETGKTPATKAEAKNENEVQSSQYDKDPRIRLGAYRIVGVQKTVTAKEGQTLASISKAHLGPGMECYVEAINNTKEVKPGQTVKIPELKLKKKKNANK